MTARPLTDGEIALARAVFGDSLDYDRIRILDTGFGGPLQGENTLKTVFNNIYAYRQHQDDFSKSPAYMQAVFLHEMTHVWQYQSRLVGSVTLTDIRNMFSHTSRAYQYTLSDKKDFLRYGLEQQASIIEDYFALKRDPSACCDGCRNACGADEKIRLYEKVLEKFLKNPSYARRGKPRGPFSGPPPGP